MLEWIMGFVGLCESALAAGKTLIEWRESQLTGREQELLRSAAEDGLFHLTSSDWHGKFVVVCGKGYIGTDPADTADYLDAFTRLCERGLVVHQQRSMFRLSGYGFKLARQLRDQQQT